MIRWNGFANNRIWHYRRFNVGAAQYINQKRSGLARTIHEMASISRRDLFSQWIFFLRWILTDIYKRKNLLWNQRSSEMPSISWIVRASETPSGFTQVMPPPVIKPTPLASIPPAITVAAHTWRGDSSLSGISSALRRSVWAWLCQWKRELRRNLDQQQYSV